MTIIPVPVISRAAQLPQPVVNTIQNIYVIQQNLPRPENVDRILAERRGQTPAQQMAVVEENPLAQDGDLPIDDNYRGQVVNLATEDDILDSGVCGPRAEFVVEEPGTEVTVSGFSGLMNTGRYRYAVKNIGESIANSEYDYWAIWKLAIGAEKQVATVRVEKCEHNGAEILGCYGPDLSIFSSADLTIRYGGPGCPLTLASIPIDPQTHAPDEDVYCYPEEFFSFINTSPIDINSTSPHLLDYYLFDWPGDGDLNTYGLELSTYITGPEVYIDWSIGVHARHSCHITNGLLGCPGYSLDMIQDGDPDFDSVYYGLSYDEAQGRCNYIITDGWLWKDGTTLVNTEPEDQGAFGGACSELDFSGFEVLFETGSISENPDDGEFSPSIGYGFSAPNAPDLAAGGEWVDSYSMEYHLTNGGSFGSVPCVHTSAFGGSISCENIAILGDFEYTLMYHYGTEYNPTLYSCPILSDFYEAYSTELMTDTEVCTAQLGLEFEQVDVYLEGGLSYGYNSWLAFENPSDTFEVNNEGWSGEYVLDYGSESVWEPDGSVVCDWQLDNLICENIRIPEPGYEYHLTYIYGPETTPQEYSCSLIMSEITDEALIDDGSDGEDPQAKFLVDKSCYAVPDASTIPVADIPAGSILPVVGQSPGGYFLQVEADLYTGPGTCWIWMTTAVTVTGDTSGLDTVDLPPDTGDGSGGSTGGVPAAPAGANMSHSGDNYTVSWPSVAGATFYRLDARICNYMSSGGSSSGGDGSEQVSVAIMHYIDPPPLTGTSYSFEHLSLCGRSPEVVLKACNSYGCSPEVWP